MSVPLTSALKRAVLAGLAAALVVSVFHLVWTEPVIDRAIGIEEQMSPSHDGEDPVVVSRELQKGGLVLVLSIAGVWLAAALARYAQRRGAPEVLSWLVAFGFIAIFAAILYALLPA